jgi:hypothetical protein
VEKEFLTLGEMQAIGLPAGRTLRNRLDARTGLIQLGGDVPPLRTVLLGGFRVVIRRDLETWLQAIAEGRPATEAAASATPALPVRRGRGRPRKGVSA